VSRALPAVPRRGRRVLILFSDIGEGHASAAQAIAEDIASLDADAEIHLVNALSHMGGFMRILQRDLYKAQLAHMPWLYGFWYRLFDLIPLVRAFGALAICAFGCRPLKRLVRQDSPDVVVSTDPRATIALGHLRLRRQIEQPVCAAVTDLGGLKFWVHPGVDIHLAPHPDLLPELERLAGKGCARTIRPPVHPRFYEAMEQTEARESLGLPTGVPIVLLSGGGWGTGDFQGAISAALALPEAHVVCLCGHNERCRVNLEALVDKLDEAASRVRVLGFSERMNELLTAADVLVHATGGVTCLEASVRRCPVIVYGALHGHLRSVAQAMEELGEAVVARSRTELEQSLSALLDARPNPGLDVRRQAKPAAVILAASARQTSWRQLGPWLALGKQSSFARLATAPTEDLTLVEDT
jgi:processive 1,2-diacylglycerol beta-glucosyltransferase